MKEYEIQGYYNERCGWERLTTESSKNDAEIRLKEYNEKGFAHRIVEVS